MRELNRSLVLDILKAESPISRAMIAQRAALAKPTVSGIVDDLIQEGMAREIGIGAPASDGGRPPILLEFNRRSQFVVGVHVGVKTTTIMVGDALGVEVARRSYATPRRSAAVTLNRTCREIHAALDELGITVRKLGAIGVVIPGMVDVSTGACLLAPNLGWRDVPVRDLVRKQFGSTLVYVYPGLQASAAAEYLEGAGVGIDNFVLLYVGSGYGCGVVLNGRVHHGFTGVTGEIGHTRVPGLTHTCGCGKIGCLETVAATPALLRMTRERLAAGAKSTLSAVAGDKLDPLTIKDAAEQGDALALEVIDELGRYIGLATTWIINLLNPEMVAVSGGLAQMGELLLKPLRETVLLHGLDQATAKVRIVRSELGQDADVRGAVLLALQQSETYYRVVFQP